MTDGEERRPLGLASDPTIGRRSTRRISAVIPAKNEARNIGWVVARLPVSVEELILVDGRSTDRTVQVVRSIRPDAIVVHDDEPGKGAALRRGFEAATGDYVVMIDADGSMDPLEIPRMIEALDAGADLVKGSRFLPDGGTADMSLLRYLGNQALLALSNKLFGTEQTDLCYGFAAFRRAPVAALDLTAVGFEIETQLFLRSIRTGLLVMEAPSFEAPRRTGASNLRTFRDGWRVLRTIMTERRRVPGPSAAVHAHRTPPFDVHWLEPEGVAVAIQETRSRIQVNPGAD